MSGLLVLFVGLERSSTWTRLVGWLVTDWLALLASEIGCCGSVCVCVCVCLQDCVVLNLFNAHPPHRSFFHCEQCSACTLFLKVVLVVVAVSSLLFLFVGLERSVGCGEGWSFFGGVGGGG